MTWIQTDLLNRHSSKLELTAIFTWITIQQESNTRQSLHRTNQKLNESLTATLRFSLINLDNKAREKMGINDIHKKMPMQTHSNIEQRFNRF